MLNHTKTAGRYIGDDVFDLLIIELPGEGSAINRKGRFLEAVAETRIAAFGKQNILNQCRTRLGAKGTINLTLRQVSFKEKNILYIANCGALGTILKQIAAEGLKLIVRMVNVIIIKAIHQ